ncbi:MAG: hypothetical protein ACP5RD_01620, partial [bacterium]
MEKLIMDFVNFIGNFFLSGFKFLWGLLFGSSLIIGILIIAMLLITFVFKNTLSDIYYYNKAVKLLDLNVQYMEESSKHYRNG